MDYVPALNRAREALLETLSPVCDEVDAIDIALQHYEQVLEECGYVVVPLEATAAMVEAALVRPRDTSGLAIEQWRNVWRSMVKARPDDSLGRRSDKESGE
jgi:hypothetical protein